MSRGEYMKKKKPIGKSTYIAFGLLIAILLGSQLFGLTARGSGLRVGYSDSYDGHSWEAKYLLHTGFRERTVNVDNQPGSLHLVVTTESGTFGVTITDMSGNVIHKEEYSDSQELDIDIPGKVIVRVTGAGHKGSFSIRW